MKTLFLSALATLSAGVAAAGSITYVAPSNDVLIEPNMGVGMGGSGSWLVPLVIVAVLALALTIDSEYEEQ